MLDPKYLREQAQTCRKLAGVLSNTDTADMFIGMALDYDSRADRAEETVSDDATDGRPA